ncbi:MAG TPA: septum site-determining protein MinC [Pseudolabrys sp.]|nr:septum site-determining protein MinC [Pseudolabrys sp.]
MAVVLCPDPPIAEWIAEIDQRIKGAESFIAGAPIVLDLSAVKLSKLAIVHLITELEQRGIRILGLENVDPVSTGAGLPPLLRSGHGGTVIPEKPQPAPDVAEAPKECSTLLLDKPIRSGQSVFFPDGDVTVLGSVASGAELVAGGSIHVYGTLRGRAMAGSNGNPQARIFCRRIDAELLAIDGYYLTADAIDRDLHNGPVQAWLDGDVLKIAALD